MTTQAILYPRQPVPALSVTTTDGGTWTLNAEPPENFTMIVFFRGLHCPICSRYLADLNNKLGKFAELGVTAIAISSDDQARAEQCKIDWAIPDLPLGYGLSLEDGRKWGLFISTSKGKTSAGIEEPPLFIEPGLFLVRPDGTLYASSIQTMPFARPSFAEILGAVKFITENNYPGRGEVLDHTAQAAE